MTLPGILKILKIKTVKNLFALVLVSSLASCAGGDGGVGGVGGVATLNVMGVSWTAPSEREDGTPLQLSEIASYHIYYGTEPGDYPNEIYVDDPSAVQAQEEDLVSGTYYVVVTAIDWDGRESLYSPEMVINL